MLINKQMTPDHIAEKYSEGLFPKSGDWYYPYRWITREDFINEFSGGDEQARMLLDQWDKQLSSDDIGINNDIDYSQEADILMENAYYYKQSKYYRDVIDNLMEEPIDIDNSIPVNVISETLIPYLVSKIWENPDNDKLRVQLNLAHINSYLYGETKFGERWSKSDMLNFFEEKKENDPDFDIINELENMNVLYRDTRNFFRETVSSARELFDNNQYYKLKDYFDVFENDYFENMNTISDLIDFYENYSYVSINSEYEEKYKEYLNYYELSDEDETDMTTIIDMYSDSIFGDLGSDFEHLFELMIDSSRGMPDESFISDFLSKLAQRIPDNISPYLLWL